MVKTLREFNLPCLVSNMEYCIHPFVGPISSGAVKERTSGILQGMDLVNTYPRYLKAHSPPCVFVSIYEISYGYE